MMRDAAITGLLTGDNVRCPIICSSDQGCCAPSYAAVTRVALLCLPVLCHAGGWVAAMCDKRPSFLWHCRDFFVESCH